MRYLFAIVFVFLFGVNKSQTKKIDSLKICFQNANIDTTKIKLLVDLGNEYFKTKDSALAFQNYYKAKLLSKNLNKFYVMVLRKEAFTLRKLAHYSSAIDTLLKVINVCDKKNYISLIGTYNDIGVTYRNIGSYEAAIKYGLNAINICESIVIKDDAINMNAYNSLANSYTAFGFIKKDTINFNKAIYYYSKAKKYVNLNQK